MTEKLITEEELADLLDIPLRRMQGIRLREDWPHTKFGRAYRYTPEQVDEIIRRHSHAGTKPLVGIPGQTQESIRRSQRPRQATRIPGQTEESWRRSR